MGTYLTVMENANLVERSFRIVPHALWILAGVGHVDQDTRLTNMVTANFVVKPFRIVRHAK